MARLEAVPFPKPVRVSQIFLIAQNRNSLRGSLLVGDRDSNLRDEAARPEPTRSDHAPHLLAHTPSAGSSRGRGRENRKFSANGNHCFSAMEVRQNAPSGRFGRNIRVAAVVPTPPCNRLVGGIKLSYDEEVARRIVF